MTKDPAFLFYTSDFLTGTMFMTNEQIGIYIRLLCSQHQHGGLIDKVTFNSLVGSHEMLRTKFLETDKGFYNERLAKEVQLRAKKSSNMSKTAKEVWEKRKAELTLLEQMESKSNTNVQNKGTNVVQPEDVNEDEIKNKNNYDFVLTEYKEPFEKWLQYKTDRKEKYKSDTSIELFYKKLVKLSNNNPKIATDIVEQSMANNWAGIFELKATTNQTATQPYQHKSKPHVDLTKPKP